MNVRPTPVRRGIAVTLLAFVLAGTVTVRAQEFDWQGSVEGTGSGRFAKYLDEADFNGSVTVSLLLKSLLEQTETRTVELFVQPSYTWTDTRPYLVNLDRAEAAVRYSGFGGGAVLRGSAGRFTLREKSELIVTHPIDGVEARLSSAPVQARLAAGYTGLLLNPSSTIRVSETDVRESSDNDAFFGPRRLLALAEVTVPAILWRQSVTGAYLANVDLRDAESTEDTVNSHYIGAVVDGPLLPGLFLDTAVYLSPATVEVGDSSTTTMGLLASLRLRYFRPAWNSSRIGLRAVLVRGVEDTDRFYVISERMASMVASVPLENVIYAELSYSLRPLGGAARRTMRDIQTTLTGRTLLRANTDIPVDATAAKATGDGPYIGSEAALEVGWRVLSDLGVSLSGGVFVPGTGDAGAFTDERTTELLGRLQVSASF